MDSYLHWGMDGRMDRESHRLMNVFFSLVETTLAMKVVMVMTIAMAVRLAGWC